MSKLVRDQCKVNDPKQSCCWKVIVVWLSAKYVGICAPHLPIQSAHTHREHTPGAVGSHLCCSTRGAVEGLMPCSRALRGIEGGESAVHSLTPPTIPAGPRLEPATFRLRVWLSNFKLPQNIARLMQISCRLHNYNNRLMTGRPGLFSCDLILKHRHIKSVLQINFQRYRSLKLWNTKLNGDFFF